jgi:hypothetical protein
VGGGRNNTVAGNAATIAGGSDNTTDGFYATVPGGLAGAAEADRSFVWNNGASYHDIPNSNTDGLSSNTAVNGESVTGTDTFSVSATGGVRFITGTVESPQVTYIPSDSAGWTTTSSRTVKTNIDPIEPAKALSGVEQMEIATWEYENDDGEGSETTHIGPMAEDFHDAFDVGSSDKHINSINADGAAFAAIQGLSEKLDEKDDRIDGLEQEVEQKEDQIEELKRESEQKDDRIDDLESRLERLEAHLDAQPADD